ncbi:MAG: hypothetical protein IJP11_02575 [Oscillospiraceae bacterium]|nr:hypothetical protein [Oscillospiraceae bacterium]
MCRIKHLYGAVLGAFGAGLLLGLLIPSGFFQTLLGFALIGLGFVLHLK